MEFLKRWALKIILCLSLGVSLAACGWGGTEVGNPGSNDAGEDSAGDPAAAPAGDPETPTPTPESLTFDE